MVITEDIVQACKKKNRDAQRIVYNFYAGRMKALVYRYVKNYEEAKDLVQDGFIKIFSKIDTFDSSLGSLDSWVARIMINTAISFLQKKKRLPFEAAEPVGIQELSSQSETLSEGLYTEDELMQAVDQLHDSLRIVFCMYVFDEISHKEIGSFLDIKEETSRTRLKRAKEQIREFLYKMKEGSHYSRRN